ncbi:type II toxin-antitoxin system RelE/ParE family toxin [Caulobacter soli]|uniref:type II toxin-antitoxin system RelE/ParE family toxin n=1 Tax=Caulobacter soli TaxID=2708539 RepID=UPI001FECD16B|nr:type II toxin-antitoxin system RelE/ParE family toxin [Caulobacter soli]
MDRCETLSAFPERGAPRFDVRPGLRTLPFRRTTITYTVKDAEVIIIGIFYGGQDYESILVEEKVSSIPNKICYKSNKLTTCTDPCHGRDRSFRSPAPACHLRQD